ncbi:hypothetical protein AB0C51_15970 [Streptomyces pathocidini]|uniref:Secreted protein n=1 Tax=Streptomyces pathocidini TaxID=1650571 RepID=A0ABW7UR76_9ACTN|nr:hypothetical protein [Streptomyces pathocidini]
MEAAMLILALLFLALVVLGAYATVKAVGAAKRGVDRTVAQARRTVEDTALKARQLAQPGVLGQVAEVRLSLRTSMRATQDALHAAPSEDASLSEALALFERLSAHGRELDAELRQLEQEPDRARTAARLPELRERTLRITGHADELRWAAQDRARRFADDDLAALGTQIEVETGALRHWTAGPEAGAGARTEREAAAATPPPSSWPDVSRPDAPAQEPPPAITAKDPRQRIAYPWEKTTRRPESTT